MRQFLRQTIDSRFDSVGSLGEKVRSLAETRCAPEIAGDIQTCVVEAANNVIEHAYRGEDGHQLTVGVDFEDDGHVEITLTDTGRALPAELIATAPPMPTFDIDDLDTLPEGGFGLALIWAMVDEVNYETRDGVNTLRMIKRLEPAM